MNGAGKRLDEGEPRSPDQWFAAAERLIAGAERATLAGDSAAAIDMALHASMCLQIAKLRGWKPS